MSVEGSTTKSPLVYLVEDEPWVAATLSDILRYSGCQVKAFLSGTELIAYPTDSSPDVVITDFVMQPVNGLSLAAWVSCSYPRARVIMITADEHPARSVAGHDLPFLILEKPLNSTALIAAVHGIDLNEVQHNA